MGPTNRRGATGSATRCSIRRRCTPTSWASSTPSSDTTSSGSDSRRPCSGHPPVRRWRALAGSCFGRSAGIATGLILAFYAPAIFFDALIQKSVLDLFCLSLVLWLLAGRLADLPRPSHGAWFATGLAMGALILTRENAVALAVVLAGWTAARRPPPPRRKALAATAALLAGRGLRAGARRGAKRGGGRRLLPHDFAARDQPLHRQPRRGDRQLRSSAARSWVGAIRARRRDFAGRDGGGPAPDPGRSPPATGLGARSTGPSRIPATGYR